MELTEQVPGTPPPKRRRRRWLIVAFALVLVSMVSWWYWPRGDARFVGSWRGHDARFINPFTLSSNGQGEFRMQGYRRVFRWRVEGEWLVIGWGLPKPISNTIAAFSGLTKSRLGFELLTQEFRYKIVELAHDRLHLSSDGTGSLTKYIRIRE